MFIGKRVEIRESTEIASVYQELSRKDRLAADCLFQQRLYNEAAYFYIQSMEKRVKEFICKKIDVSKSYYADMLRGTGHSLENSIEIHGLND